VNLQQNNITESVGDIHYNVGKFISQFLNPVRRQTYWLNVAKGNFLLLPPRA